MALLKEEDRQHLIKEFEALKNPVKLLMFTQELECEYCRETVMIAEEVADLSDSISVEVYNLVTDKEVAEQYNIDKVPAITVLQDGDEPDDESVDYGIRYYGIPSGYEFSSLIEDVMMVSQGESGLSEATKTQVAELTEPVHIQVFVTPTCPYCTRAVRLAHQLALESNLIRADMVEAIEFPHLSAKYQVQGVPRTVINETVHIEGAVPEPMLMTRFQEAVG